MEIYFCHYYLINNNISLMNENFKEDIYMYICLKKKKKRICIIRAVTSA